MVDEQVAVLEAERQGIRVSDDELAQRIFAIPGLQENGRFIGEARYEQLLRQQRPPLTKAQFEDRFRRGIMVERLRTALTDWMAVSDTELETEYRKRNEKVKLQVVALTADSFRDKVSLSDADVAAYFEAHKAEYRVGEQRSIKYLLIDRDQVRLKTVVPPNDIQRYYNDNIQQYQTPEQIRASHILLKTDGKDEAAVRKRAEALLAQVKGGADFAALAKKESEDEGSKAAGGDLGLFGRGRMVPEFETAAFAMQPGQTSDLVRSQFGFHIIRVIEKKAGETRPLDEVRPQIQEQLSQQQADLQVSQRAEQLQARIKDPGDLAEAAGEQGLMVQESGFFQRGDPVPGLGNAPQVSAAAFTLGRQRRRARALPAQRGAVFITVSGKKDPYVPKLEEVKERVRQDAIRAKASELSRARAAEVAAALKSAAELRRCRQSAGARSQGHRSHHARRRAAGRGHERRGGQGRVQPAGRRRERPDLDARRHGDRQGRAARRDHAGAGEGGQRDVPRRAAQRTAQPVLQRLHGQGEGADEGRDQRRSDLARHERAESLEGSGLRAQLA